MLKGRFLTNPNILIFSGSIRTDSKNALLAKAIATALPEHGGSPTLVSLQDYEMPIYNGDLEARDGAPKTAQDFARLMSDHDGVVIVSPEYNAGMPPILKNTLDWVSRIRPQEGEQLSPFKGPVFALAGASPGSLATIRNLTATRTMLSQGFGALIIPEQVGVPQASSAFDKAGILIAERPKAMMDAMLASLVKTASALRKVR